MQKKIVKRYEKYGRKVGSIVKWYGRKASWNVKWYGNYVRKLWNDMENMEENSEKIWKIQKKIVKSFGNYERK